MIRATLDTNALASGAVAVAGPVAALIDAWRHRDLEVVVSPHIVTELERTLGKPYFARRLSPRMREEFLRLVRENTTIVTITTPVPNVLRTRADNLVLATAESAGVAYIVSGDRELQQLGRYQDIAILSPRDFLDLLMHEIVTSP